MPLPGGITLAQAILIQSIVGEPILEEWTSLSAVGIPPDVFAVAVERCEHEAERINRIGATGEEPYARLLADGHGEVWRRAGAHIATHACNWQSAIAQ